MTTVGKILRETTLAGPEWNQVSNDGSHLSLVCTGTACWAWFMCSRLLRKRSRRESITAAQRLCGTLGEKTYIREEFGIYTSSRDIEIQLHIPVMCDRISRPLCVCVLTL